VKTVAPYADCPAVQIVHQDAQSQKKEGHWMMKRTIRPLASLSIMLLLLTGCASVRIGPEANEAAIVSRELVKTTRSWDGKILPAYAQGQPEVTIRRITVPAGARLETHRHPVINAGVVMSGQLTVVTLDGKTLHLKAGDPIVEVVNTLHYGINEGKVPAELVVFYAGAVNTPITVVIPVSDQK
jgi:quercetin dioxygenase-like cupin family protein